MKKLLLIAAIIMSVAHQTNAVGNKKDFFNELNEEYFEKKVYQLEEIMRSQRQRDKLITKTKQATFPLIHLLFLMPHRDYLANLRDKVGSIKKEGLSDTELYDSMQELKNEYAVNLYEKKIPPYSIYVDENAKDNENYHESLLSLEVTKKNMEYNLKNVSWFQWLWNNKAYRNYQNSIQTLDQEIVLFKDQDEVVSPLPKKVYIVKEDRKNIGKANRQFVGSYIKPILTHREVFTRSSMQRTMFEEIKRARE